MAGRDFSSHDYEFIRQFLEQACGIVLGDNKHYLVSSRLNHLMKEYGAHSLSALVERIKNDRRSGLRERIIDAMTTNETSWFRDGYPYEILKEVILPERTRKHGKAVRIWSAACSSGQEPYSISMAGKEFQISQPGLLSDLEIIATDLSPSMLNEARAGIYDNMSLMRGISEERKQRFFTRQNNSWHINSEISSRVVFKELNLMKSFILLGKFDVIFCRNVLIYFSAQVKCDILSRLTAALKPGGYLLLGGTEAMGDHAEKYEIVRHRNILVYRLKGAK